MHSRHSPSHAAKKCAPEGGPSYGFVYVDQEGFEQYKPLSLAALLTSICEYQVAP